MTGNKNIDNLISTTGKAIPPSGIRQFFDIVYSTPDCISLGVGEPDFATPWRISDIGINAIKDGYTHYTPNRGVPELREVIADYTKKRHNLDYCPDSEMIITMGVSQGLDLALRSIINPGDEVIIVEPCYVSYTANVTMLHGVPVPVDTYFDNNFEVDPADLEKKITQKTKAVLLNYPSNPTGGTLTRETLEKIALMAQRHNLIIISDEIYSAITFRGKHFSIASLPGMKERTIYLNGFSKSHAMTGWRLGFVAGPENLISIMLKIHQYTALCAPSMAQYAAIEAIREGDKAVDQMNREYLKRRNYIVNGLNGLGLSCLEPGGAFYVFPSITSTGRSSYDFCMELLDKEKVAVVPGNAFGKSGEGFIRCSYATSMENLTGALKGMERYLKSL